MDNDNLSRLSRLTAILIQLQTKRIVSATTLAERFEVSTRTIYRDIRALEQAGVPIITEDGKGYSLMEGYKLPPVMFTEEEAAALITAEQLASANADKSFAAAMLSAVNKIKAVLRATTKEKTELLSARIAVSPMMRHTDVSHSLIIIQQALTDFKVLHIRYQSAGKQEETTRSVEPFALYYCLDESWALIAYCRLRADFRMFRLDRIRHLELTQLEFHPHRITLKEYLAEKAKKFQHP